MEEWVNRVYRGMNGKYKCLVKKNSGNEASSKPWVFPWEDGDAGGVDLWDRPLKPFLSPFTQKQIFLYGMTPSLSLSQAQ